MSSDWETAGNTVTQSQDPSLRERVHEWLFLTGNRMRLAGLLLVGVVVAFAGTQLLVAFEAYDVTAFLYLAAAATGGNFTLITIVLSINQLVISRQLSAPGELEAEIQATTEYRNTVTGGLDQTTAPASPIAFLKVSFDSVKQALRALDDYSGDHPDEVADEVDTVVASFASHLEATMRKLEASNQTVFSALVLTLNTNYSREMTKLARLQAKLDDGDEPAELHDRLETLVTRLKQIDVARQYLKTLYMQEELARLSRRLLYVGGPTIFATVAALGLVAVGGTGVFQTVRPTVTLPVLVGVSIAPLAVLLSFILRLSVVAERTVAVTPFTTSTQEETSVVEITQE
jgi:hypothetical protein